MVSMIVNKLEKIGLKCWYAYRDIPPGEKWSSSIVGTIKHSKVFLLIFSSNSNTSSEVEKEIDLGLKYCDGIIPFRIEDIPLSDSMEYHLNHVHWMDAFTDTQEQHIFALTERILKTLPEEESPEVINPTSDDYDVFISYASKDRQVADEVRKSLVKKQIGCWMAPYSMGIGESYLDSIRNGIENSKLFLLIVSSHADQSEYVIKEVSLAIDNELKILPLKIDDVQLSGKLAMYMSDIQHYDFQIRNKAVHADIVAKIDLLLKKAKK